jgi:hypothetical protein
MSTNFGYGVHRSLIKSNNTNTNNTINKKRRYTFTNNGNYDE